MPDTGSPTPLAPSVGSGEASLMPATWICGSGPGAAGAAGGAGGIGGGGGMTQGGAASPASPKTWMRCSARSAT